MALARRLVSGVQVLVDAYTAIVGGADADAQVAKLAIGAAGSLEFISKGEQSAAQSIPFVPNTEFQELFGDLSLDPPAESIQDRLKRIETALGRIDTGAAVTSDDDGSISAFVKLLAKHLGETGIVIRDPASSQLLQYGNYSAVRDDGPNWTTSLGIGAAVVKPTTAHTTDTAVTDAPVAGQSLVVDDLFFSSDAAVTVQFKEETSGIIKIEQYVPARFVGQITTRGKFKLPNINKKLMIRTSAVATIAVTALYHSEA